MANRSKKNQDKLTRDESRRYVRNFWKVVFAGVAFAFVFMLSVSLGVLGELPSLAELENPKTNLAAEIWSADQKLLGTFYRENRSFVSYDEVSPNVVKALVSTEDKRFYRHSGIDFRRTFTSTLYTLLGDKQGGSTITQQLALNLYDQRSSNFFVRFMQKFRELVVAIRLERRYTKQEIIAMYLNTVNFGNNSYGINMAARTFFNTTPAELSVPQAATLIGLVKAPSYYSPILHPDNATRRRNVVMKLMQRSGEITAEEYARYSQEPIELDRQPTMHYEGPAPYFREFLRHQVQQMIDAGMIPEKGDGSRYNIYTDGLKIYTTLDSRMQRYATEAVQEHLSELQRQFFSHWGQRAPWANRKAGENPVFEDQASTVNRAVKRTPRYRSMAASGMPLDSIKKVFQDPVEMKVFSWEAGRVNDFQKDTVMSPLDSVLYYKWFLRSSLLSVDPQTGYIKAWVGGPDYRYFQYDAVQQVKRQVGSTFKPVVYTEAIEDYGYDPCFPVANVPVSFTLYDGSVYTPKNSEGEIGGVFQLQEGLARSLNTFSAYLVKDIGAESVIERAEKMGINTKGYSPVPSIGLGVFETTLYEMVSAYSAIANQGMRKEPVYITRIENRQGDVIYNRIAPPREAMREQTAYTMLHMMKGTSTLSGGTAGRLRTGRAFGNSGFNNPIAAKTGTTQDNADGWFIGMVPNLATGVWTGGEDRSVYWRSTNLGQGANVALPVWGRYMKKVYADTTLEVSAEDFPPPSDTTINTTFDCTDYQVPPDMIQQVRTDTAEEEEQQRPERDRRLDF